MAGLLRQLIVDNITVLVLDDELHTSNLRSSLLDLTFLFMAWTVVVLHFLLLFRLLTWTFRFLHNRIRWFPYLRVALFGRAHPTLGLALIIVEGLRDTKLVEQLVLSLPVRQLLRLKFTLLMLWILIIASRIPVYFRIPIFLILLRRLAGLAHFLLF